MSKVYEALKRAQEEGTGFRIRIDGDSDEMPRAVATEPPGEPEPAVAVEPVEDDGEGIRMIPLAVPADSVAIPWNGTADAAASEQYRVIRTRIVQHPKRPKMLLITSSNAGDGKTVSAINIAGALALRDDANVLLIDADFRRRGLCKMIGLPGELGLANLLAGTCQFQDAIVRVEQYPNLYVLPAGISKINPAELLDSKAWNSVCATVREHFDFVILDAPPIAAVADYELIQAKCDGVIMVVRPDHTDRTLCAKAFELIPREKNLGVVLNCAYQWFLFKTHESYYYGSGSR
jgi:capsular exopolysaccharide synthesis family protein